MRCSVVCLFVSLLFGCLLGLLLSVEALDFALVSIDVVRVVSILKLQFLFSINKIRCIITPHQVHLQSELAD